MFTQVEGFESLNMVQDVQDGNYFETISCYQSRDGLTTAHFKEFRRDDLDCASVCDLLIVLPNHDVLFRDFMRLDDGTWRDSYGGLADSIDELLPNELSDLRLISRNKSTFVLRRGKVETKLFLFTNTPS